MPMTCAGPWQTSTAIRITAQIFSNELCQIAGFINKVVCKQPDISMHSSIGGGEWSAELRHQMSRAQTLGPASRTVCTFLLCSVPIRKAHLLHVLLIAVTVLVDVIALLIRWVVHRSISQWRK